MLLVVTGLCQAALMIAGAYMLGRFLSAQADQARTLFFGAMLSSGIIALLAHAVGRWLAERFGQNYVAICRVRLLKAIVRSGGETSRHGITMTRLITDLSSVKNWVGQGIAGGTAHAAGLFGLVIGAWLISPAALLAIGTAFIATTALMACTALPLRQRIREARDTRGVLSARIGEAVLTARSIRNLGMLDQKKREIYRYSNRLAEKLSLRYGLASLLRQSPELGFLLGIATLGFVGEQGHAMDVGGTAMGVLILAAATASLRQLGQSFDLWLSYAEARRRLTTALGNAGLRATPWQDTGPLGVSCRRIKPTASCRKSSFAIAPMEHIAFPANAAVSKLLRAIAGLSSPDGGRVMVTAPSNEARIAKRTSRAALLVSPDLPLQRGTIRSNLTAACPDVDDRRLLTVAEHCDIHDDGPRKTSLLDAKIGEAGQGLSPSLTARVQLARAVLTGPGILLIDDPIFEIDAEVKRALNRIVATERLTVLIAVHGAIAPITVHRSFREDRGRLVEDQAEPSAGYEPQLIQMAKA